MAQFLRGGGRFVVGDYVVEKQIGYGSFSTVWLARHRAHGAEVAIKEIHMARLNSKLQESLKFEIDILKKINHPHIIRLHDIIEDSGKIYIVLEYCKGGDLSKYILQRQGRIPEATAKHLMQQLASGLKILHDNNLIHRDLKPQNLLLSTNNETSILKIADFGFARSLHSSRLAETLCGSPLYMAPEIMQLQKYDAKADLWSVGAILFQLVTGRTPFTGNTQIQLLQNIVKSTDLQFPPEVKGLSPDCIDLCQKLLRRNPVERLTFGEFFNHPFLHHKQPDDILRNRRPQRVIDDFTISKRNSVVNTQENFQEDSPFSPDDDSTGPDVNLSELRTAYGFPLEAKVDKKESFSTTNNIDSMSEFSISPQDLEADDPSTCQLSEGNLKGSLIFVDHRPITTCSKEADSMEFIDQDYVLVSGPPFESSLCESASKYSFPSKSVSPPLPSGNITSASSVPVQINGGATSKAGSFGTLGCHRFSPTTRQGSVDILDTLEKPSADCMARIESLTRCALAISELVEEKMDEKKQLEAFSIQLVIVAVWKQALEICNKQAAYAVEGSFTQDNAQTQEASEVSSSQGAIDSCSKVARAFLLEVGNAEDLAQAIEPGRIEMPDAMETIYQAALDLGKHGAVKEYMGDVESADLCYTKAVHLLVFLLVEAPSLVLNPPFSLTNSERCRLQNYIDLLLHRQSISKSQRV